MLHTLGSHSTRAAFVRSQPIKAQKLIQFSNPKMLPSCFVCTAAKKARYGQRLSWLSFQKIPDYNKVIIVGIASAKASHSCQNHGWSNPTTTTIAITETIDGFDAILCRQARTSQDRGRLRCIQITFVQTPADYKEKTRNSYQGSSCLYQQKGSHGGGYQEEP